MPLHGSLWISQNKGATDATPRVFVDLTKQGSNRCHSTGLCGSHKTREQQMPLHGSLWISQNKGATDATPRVFVDLTKQGSNRCHSTGFVDLTKAFDYEN